MSKFETILLEKFWPTPTQSPFAEIELELGRTDSSELQWNYKGEIRFGQESVSMVSICGTFEAMTADEAKSKAYSKLVWKCGSLIADLIAERDDYKRLLEIEKQNDRRQPGAR